ncbi:MAG: YifB family Mg chelatase-like AAA ATPase [Arenicellales bacterium]
MSLAVVQSRAEQGVSAQEVSVEVHLTGGLPAFSIVGLPEAAVRESKDRVRSALISANFEFPRKKITVNLAPADLPKEGGRYDLPIAIGILAASGVIPQSALDDKVFIGELALTGALRSTRGGLVTALSLREQNLTLCLPLANAEEASAVPNINILPAAHIIELVAILLGQQSIQSLPEAILVEPVSGKDISDVKGQAFAKRALMIAAAGNHNILMYGPPGTGKSMLAERFAGLLPELPLEQALEAAAIASVSNDGLDMQRWRQRPFRSPHHSASSVAIVGGGAKAMPGEISLAHHGVLFLDEFTEFDKRVLESLREPLESGKVSIARAAYRATYPAKFILVAAMNPCQCGFHGDAQNPARCRCTPDQISRYRAKLSGPLLDRIDMHIEVPRVPQTVLSAPSPEDEPNSAQIRDEIEAVQAQQLERQACLNSALSVKQIDEFCRLDEASQQLIDTAMLRLGLSARGYHRILKLARSIADLEGAEQIQQTHLGQAIQLRSLDRSG